MAVLLKYRVELSIILKVFLNIFLWDDDISFLIIAEHILSTWRTLCNDDLHDLYSSSGYVTVM
jgi:hypothetical protein